jgi:prephenate dehydrogenase
LATELAEMLKGKPFFVDPVEADGLVAEEEFLPKLVASAYLRALVDQPGWKDGRRFASKTFFRLASLSKSFDEEEYFGISSLMNKESTSRAMGALITSLQELQQLIDAGDEEALRQYLASSRHGFETWYDQRISSNWEAEKKEEIPPARDILGRFFGGKPRKKP